jgi:ribosomal protein S18 acetylase RimI-like enzyme
MRLDIRIVPMSLAQYAAVYALWQGTEGLGLDASDSRPAIARFLERNPGFSFVAVAPDDRIVGAVLCGHDGRRGFLYHLAVAQAWRAQGIGKELVRHALAQLATAGISKCSIHVFRDHLPGQAFWARLGWCRREDILLLQDACHKLK